MTSTLFSTRDAIDRERFYAERRISAGHRLLHEAVGDGALGGLWVVRGPLRERSSVIDGIAAASLIDRRSITYASLHRSSSQIGLSVVATGAETSVQQLVDGAAGDRTAIGFELSETRLFDIVGTDLDLVEGLRHAAPPDLGRPLDLLVLDGVDLAPHRVMQALQVEDMAHGRADWIGAFRYLARHSATTVILATGDDVLGGRPDPDIGDHDVLIDVGWHDDRQMEFPVTVTSGRFERTRLLASWIPHRDGLAWRPAPDRS
ncbi:hypothetical protein [Aeromicrobium sp. NPDC092404]|uniref:hypothetical protein n=1 Tax=Aeromicrobium sp. NPDC092404 TaxID=3154976 RepID=UPI00344477A1